MTVSDAEALANELHAFCAAAPHDYPGHNIELFERVESFLRTLMPSDSASDAALADCPFCGGPGLNIAGLYVTCGAPQNECPMRGVRCDIAAWNTRTPIPVAVSRADLIRTISLSYARNDLEPDSETTLHLYRPDAEHAADAILALSLPAVAVSREEVIRAISKTEMNNGRNIETVLYSGNIDRIADAILSLPLPLQLHDRAAGVGE